MAKAIKIIREYQASPVDKVPYKVWTLFHSSRLGEKMLKVNGEEVSFGEDFGSLEDARYAIEWFANQLGGSVKWQK